MENQVQEIEEIKVPAQQNQTNENQDEIKKILEQTQNLKNDEINLIEGQQKTVIKPYPIAEKKLQVKILDLLRQGFNFKQLRKGVNESLKQLTKGDAELVIMAADCDPIEIVMSLPNICEEKNVPYCFVDSQATLGRACGIKRPVVAACIVFNEGSQINSQILEMKDVIEQLFI